MMMFIERNHRNGTTDCTENRCFEDDYLNPTFMTPKLAAAMEPLFFLMNDLAPLSRNTEAKSIWLQVLRGNIGDYDSFEDLKEYGEELRPPIQESDPSDS